MRYETFRKARLNNVTNASESTFPLFYLPCERKFKNEHKQNSPSAYICDPQFVHNIDPMNSGLWGECFQIVTRSEKQYKTLTISICEKISIFLRASDDREVKKKTF
jgi:hypothetical protein